MEMFRFNEVQWEAENVPVAQLEQNIRQSIGKRESDTINKQTNKKYKKPEQAKILQHHLKLNTSTLHQQRWKSNGVLEHVSSQKIIVINKIPIGNFFFYSDWGLDSELL